MQRILGWCLVCLFMTSGFQILGAEVNGQVVNGAGESVPPFEVILETPTGLRLSMFTDPTGGFAFKGLGTGAYRVTLLSQTGYLVIEPECSSFSLFLETSEVRSLLFKVLPTGVSVDFGKPAGGGNLGPPPLMTPSQISVSDESFSLALRLWNVHQVQHAPDTLVFRGRFDLPNHVILTVDSVRLGSNYQVNGNPIRLSRQANGEIEVRVRLLQFPFFGLDGGLLVINGTIQSPMGNWLARNDNQLCFCVSELSFFRNRGQLAGYGFAQIREPWSSCAEAESN